MPTQLLRIAFSLARMALRSFGSIGFQQSAIPRFLDAGGPVHLLRAAGAPAVARLPARHGHHVPRGQLLVPVVGHLRAERGPPRKR